MAGLFNKLPGFQQTPAGAERVTLRRLPRIAWVGTLLLLLPSLLSRLAIWFEFSSEGPGMPGMVDIYVISLIILHWTVLLTVGIYAFIVLAMKGPAYVADPYPMNDADQI
ncbi:hypothetical protein C6P61_07040 [Malikia spinosa]|uniref:Uncharacterized protein n=1 Tax=Malikia spinosa TaxID=86180 RepID=A0A2S9KG00_9BURK|nr:hypothetical protein [Malikia spinosa]PRD69380.1 hypothetical protein C6P61_07040 [Malikia spinosa]